MSLWGGEGLAVPVSDLDGYLDGMSVEKQSLTLVVDGTHVYMDIEEVDGGDISYWINGVKYTLDCTTGDGVDGKARVEVPQGTADADKWSCCYVAIDDHNGGTGLALHSSEVLPIGAFAFVSFQSIQDYATVDSTGPIMLQRTTEAITCEGQGSIARMRENARLVKGGGWWDGMSPVLTITTNAGAMDGVGLTLTAGTAYQMNRQSFPIYDISTDGIWLACMDGSGSLDNLQRLTDLGALNETRLGAALTDGDMILWDIYANVNYSEGDCKLLAIPSNEVYTDTDKMKQFAFGSRVCRIPRNHKSVGTLICRIVMKYNTADNGTWSNVLTHPQLVWKTQAQTFNTPNWPSNYGHNYDGYIATLTKSGALKIRVNFSEFNTEANYDFINLRTGASAANVHTHHGNLGPFKSGEVSGDTMRVHFHSDGSVSRRGVRSTSFEYQVSIAAGGEFIDLRG